MSKSVKQEKVEEVKDPVLALESQIQGVSNRLEQLIEKLSKNNRVQELAAAQEGMSRRLTKFGEKVRAYDPKNMLEMESRHNVLSCRLQLLIERITVVIEAGYSVRHDKTLTDHQRAQLLSATVWALDQPDEFFAGMIDMTPPRCIKRCFDGYRQAKLDGAVVDKVQQTDIMPH